MEKVPQIVSERLKAMAATAEHPDADLLTAFAERSLLETERARVLEHLARCGECREIVALALPASEPVQQVLQPTSGRRLSWPVLRWGLVAAGMVAIVSFGVMRYQSQHARSTMAYVPQQETVTKKAENLPAPVANAKSTADQDDEVQAPPASAPAESRDVQSGTASKSSLAVSSSTPKHRITPGAGGTAGPRVQWQQNINQQNANNVQLQNAPAAPPALAKQMPTGGAIRTAPVPAPSQQQDAYAYTSQAGAQPNVDTPVLESQRIDQQPSIRGRAEAKVERVKPAGTSIVTPSKVIAADMEPPSPPAGARILTATPGSPTRWTINSAGGLQRSFDQGSTWQDVDVRNSGAPAAESNLALMKAPPSRAKEANYDSLAKKDASPVVFRAVAANGPDVWAGAAGGFLYHTSDAGAHWTRVVPSASGVSLTGDILSLEFIDAQHGRITTSNPEIWTTSDAGQSWQKQ